jgi:hypothetical protein
VLLLLAGWVIELAAGAWERLQQQQTAAASSPGMKKVKEGKCVRLQSILAMCG